MVINDAILLGFDRQRRYFEGNIFAKGDVVSIAIEGTLLDETNTGSGISPMIAAGLSGLYSGSLGQSNFTDQDLGYLVGATREEGNLVAGLGAEELVVNGVNYGRGRVVSISSPTTPAELTASMTMAQRFTVDFELYEQIDAVNFTIAGSGIIDSGYAGLEPVLETYASHLDMFSETFDFDYRDDGGLDYAHNLTIKYRDVAPGAPDAITIAKSIANNIFQQRPYFGELDPDFAATNDPNQTFTVPSIYPDTRIHNAYYTESYNDISKECRFQKSWSRYKYISGTCENWANPTVGVLHNPSLLYGTGTPFGCDYTCSKQHSVDYSNGVTTVTEQGEIMCLNKHSMGTMYIGQESGNAYTRCAKIADANYVWTPDGSADQSLFSVPVHATSYQAIQDNKFGYQIAYSNNPVFYSGSGAAGLMAGSYSINRDYSLTRAADGVATVTSNHVAKPHQKKEFFTSDWHLHTLDALRDGHDTTMLVPNYKSFVGANAGLKVVNESYQFMDWGGEVGLTIKETDDQNIFVHDSSSSFAEASVTATVDHPVVEKETYLIAGCGEILHVSPQSSLGSISIEFKGVLKRDMDVSLLTRIIPKVKNYTLLDILDEAYLDCARYFAARIVNPTQLFITDTSYSWTSQRDFSLTIELKYSKDAYTSLLEVRR